MSPPFSSKPPPPPPSSKKKKKQTHLVILLSSGRGWGGVPSIGEEPLIGPSDLEHAFASVASSEAFGSEFSSVGSVEGLVEPTTSSFGDEGSSDGDVPDVHEGFVFGLCA